MTSGRGITGTTGAGTYKPGGNCASSGVVVALNLGEHFVGPTQIDRERRIGVTGK